MKQKQKLEQRISNLKSKILDLGKILSNDTAASFKESTQTTEMLQIYEKQMCSLREELANVDLGMKKYMLTRGDVKKELLLVDIGADPFKNWISKKSPLGMQLEVAKVGTKVTIGSDVYQVSEIIEV